jgi:PilZ domain-containing protein
MPDTKEKLRRRSQSRQAFTASALVFEPKSETLLRARTADLGPDGCFIDTLNPFAPGTMVKARIEKGGSSFEASAKVVYSLTAMGMGLVFQAVAPEQLWVLHEWLGSGASAEISVAVAAEEFPREAFSVTDKKTDVHCEALSRLILELMGQGLLSEEKGNAILQTLARCPEK